MADGAVDILQNARDLLATARLGLLDFRGPDANRRFCGPDASLRLTPGCGSVDAFDAANRSPASVPLDVVTADPDTEAPTTLETERDNVDKVSLSPATP
jgi:hypothetical protein